MTRRPSDITDISKWQCNYNVVVILPPESVDICDEGGMTDDYDGVSRV